ncbi:MAG: hypothetical protein J0H95_03035 [Xanthomonadales bacterium]|nr:hypothetical protein [Xanthomonadales bacterium]
MALDRIAAIADGVDAAQTQQFQYEALSRLVRSEHAGGNVAGISGSGWTAPHSKDR